MENIICYDENLDVTKKKNRKNSGIALKNKRKDNTGILLFRKDGNLTEDTL
jgi:hypothetical protein